MEAAAVYRAYNEAENRHDWDATTALLAPDVHVMVNGLDAVADADEDRRAMMRLVGLFPGYRRDVLQIVSDGANAAIRWVMTGKSAGGATPDLDVRGVSIIHVENGLITEAFLFTQGDGLVEALNDPWMGD